MITDFTFENRKSITAIQEQNFKAILDLCFERHPYYRERFSNIGLKRSDIRSLADIYLIPIISKKEYAANPEAFTLETDGLANEANVKWDVMHTTGTSGGKPTPFVSTAYDFYSILTANRRALEIRKIQETDLIANLCPMTLYPYGAYHRTIAAANVVKVPVISPLPGHPSDFFHWSASLDEVVSAIARSRATILWGVTSYVRRILMRAEEISADFSSVRLAFVTGESVSIEMRRDITERLQRVGKNDAWLSNSYAATEMQVGAVECMPESGYHNPAPEQFYFEIVDPESHESLSYGKRGLSVLTHLDRRGTVLLRYAMGDYAALSIDQCPSCGRWTDRFVGIPSRADDLIKVKGMLINPEVVIDLMLANGAINEFQIIVDKENSEDMLSSDRFRLLIDPSPNADLQGLAETVRKAIGLRPIIEITPRHKIFDPEKSLKAKRLLDLRNAP